MLNKTGWLRTGLTLAALSAVAAFSFGPGAGSAQAAVVYCKTVGVPQGCVVRPTAAVVVAPAPVVVAPVAGVGVGAPGGGVRAGEPLNRGGPVDRVGRR